MKQAVKHLNRRLGQGWSRVQPSFLPFADAATPQLPLGRLLRLSLFQVSVGMAVVLLNGTLNRVMIVELGVSAWLVSLMVALPLMFAPFRALIGFRSDHHRSVLGWRRVPFIWMGTLLQFGGLAIMPFALIILSGDTHGPLWVGPAAAALAFLLVGAGLHTAQTAGLALATDLAPEASRPRVVALLYVTLLLGMVFSSVVFGLVLQDFTQIRLIQVIQGAAVVTMVFNVLALWKQEPRNPALTDPQQERRPEFRDSWRTLMAQGRSKRFLLAVALGTAAFSMQDILLEPYGAEILKLSVANTTTLTAILAGGTLLGLALAARLMTRGADVHRLAAFGALIGVAAFSAVVMSEPFESVLLFRFGTAAIGFGGGLFAVGTLTAAMSLDSGAHNGLALGAWGAVQATAAGAAIAIGGALRDAVNGLVAQGMFDAALSNPSAGYMVVYHLEIALLFATLVVIGPLVRGRRQVTAPPSTGLGLAEFPG